MLSYCKSSVVFSSSRRRYRYLLTFFFVLFLIASLIISLPKNTASNYGKHSSELEESVTVEGNTERTSYYYNGVLTYAANKHYATLIKTTNGNTVLEEYFDENGDPVQQSSKQFALLREYDEDGNNYKTTYLGADKQPIINSSGYSTIIRTYNEAGLTEYEHYYDTHGNPVKHTSGYYGRFYGYENKRNTILINLDEKDEPCKSTSGYAMIHRTYYEEGADAGRIETDFYFDENDEPVALSNNQYGIHREYDDLGRNSVLTYLGKNGEPIRTKSGYTTIKRTFYPSNSLKTELYFDLNGEPIALKHGQYGVKYENDKTIYIDINGKEIFDLISFLNNNPLSVLLFGLIAISLSVILGKKGNIGLLCLYLLFIAYMTLISRSKHEASAELRLFWSYKQLFSSSSLRLNILYNIWLFIPLGIILYHLHNKPFMLFLPILVSLAVEVMQYFTGRGTAELDDIISNGLGGLIGFGIGYTLEPIRLRFKQIL